MKMPLEYVTAEEARGLARLAAHATDNVTCGAHQSMIVGMDSDGLPTANVNDARFLVIRIPMDEGQSIAVVKITNGGMMVQMALREGGLQ